MQACGRLPNLVERSWLWRASRFRRKSLAIFALRNGDERDRTANLVVANHALSQLSYVPSSDNDTESKDAGRTRRSGKPSVMIAKRIGFG
jgi:hypothetical protein